MKAFIKKHEAVTPVARNKTSEVLKYLKSNGSITSMEAINMFGATRLSAIIFQLRKRGYDITTFDIEKVDKYGHCCKFARYVLNK